MHPPTAPAFLPSFENFMAVSLFIMLSECFFDCIHYRQQEVFFRNRKASASRPYFAELCYETVYNQLSYKLCDGRDACIHLFAQVGYAVVAVIYAQTEYCCLRTAFLPSMLLKKELFIMRED